MRVKDWWIAQNLENSVVNLAPPMSTQIMPEIDATEGTGTGNIDIPQHLIRFPNFILPKSILARISCPHCGQESYRYLQVYPQGTSVAEILCLCGNRITVYTELQIETKIEVSVSPSVT